MIRAHRYAHRGIIVILSITLSALAVLGLSDRAGQNRLSYASPKPRLPTVNPDLEFYLASNDLWPGLPVSTYVYRNDKQVVIYLFQDQPIIEADLLVYYDPAISASRSGGTEAGKRDPGILVGSFSNAQPARIELASTQHQVGGRLVIYSGGQQVEFASITLPVFGKQDIGQTGRDEQGSAMQ